IVSVISEIKFFEPVLTSEEIPEIKANSSTPAIKLMTRNWKNQLYIFAVNLQNAPISTKINLAHFDGKLNVLYENRIQDVSENKFMAKFEPYQVHVYSTDMSLNPQLQKDIPFNFISVTVKSDLNYLLTEANWIWYPKTHNITDYECFLKKEFSLNSEVKTAKIILTADDTCTLYVNGKKIAKNDGWNAAGIYQISTFLKKGNNTIMVHAKDLGLPPGGFLCDLTIETTKEKINILSDSSWKAAKTRNENDKKNNWTNAKIVGKYGISPWWKKVLNPPKKDQ
ncbi:MAG: hypothetical protein WCS73_12220, partial [Lentisphaeria bacterium]